MYTNGNYFVVMSANTPKGSVYLLFHKSITGVKVGIAANVRDFPLSQLVQSATGIDTTSVPYFGKMVVPAMAIAITSGAINSNTLPHIFAKDTPLLTYGTTLPPGVSGHFVLSEV